MYICTYGWYVCMYICMYIIFFYVQVYVDVTEAATVSILDEMLDIRVLCALHTLAPCNAKPLRWFSDIMSVLINCKRMRINAFGCVTFVMAVLTCDSNGVLTSDTATCKINGIFQRFSTAALYQFTTGTLSERFPFILQVAVWMVY